MTMPTQKTALVTGANAGIGRALVLEFVQRGYKVYATGRRFSAETQALFGQSESIVPLILDVTSIEDIHRVRDQVNDECSGKLDFLYLNAGRVDLVLASEATDEQIQDSYEVNLFSNMRIVRAFTRLLVSAKGTIAFSGSVSSIAPLYSLSLYSSSKAALSQYAAVLQCEMRNFGVKVIDVIGGFIGTEIFEGAPSTIAEDSVFNFEPFKSAYNLVGEGYRKLGEGKMMSTEEFARKTLDKIAKADLNTVKVYEGGHAGRITFLAQWLPTKILFDSTLKIRGLNFDYREHLQEEEKL